MRVLCSSDSASSYLDSVSLYTLRRSSVPSSTALRTSAAFLAFAALASAWFLAMILPICSAAPAAMKGRKDFHQLLFITSDSMRPPPYTSFHGNSGISGSSWSITGNFISGSVSRLPKSGIFMSSSSPAPLPPLFWSGML